MKDIKSYVIGFLSCACLFLIMGQTKQDVMEDIKILMTQNGRYQATSNLLNMKYSSGVSYNYILTTVIDTRTGEVVKETQTAKNVQL